MFPDPRQMSTDEWIAFRDGIEARVRIERENAIRALWAMVLRGKSAVTVNHAPQYAAPPAAAGRRGE
jgi:hypothetical protein